MTNDHERDLGGHDGRNDHDHEREKQVPAPASKGDPLASLEALSAALNRVDLGGVIGRSGLPMLLFKREDNGIYIYGRQKTVIEEGSHWLVNIRSFMRGYISFSTDGKRKVLGERMASVTQPMPDFAQLPNTGAPWVEQWCVDLRCLTGVDTGLEVTFKTTTDGGRQAVGNLLDIVRDRLTSGQHGGKAWPATVLGKDSYVHPQYGLTWKPIWEVVDWMTDKGPEPAPAPASPPPPTPPTSTSTASTSTASSQPRRRRVA